MQERGAYAEETALKIDTEVKRILTDAHDEARRVLLRSGATSSTRCRQRLLEKEVVESAELQAILGPVPPKADDAIPAEIPPI